MGSGNWHMTGGVTVILEEDTSEPYWYEDMRDNLYSCLSGHGNLFLIYGLITTLRCSFRVNCIRSCLMPIAMGIYFCALFRGMI